MNTNYDLIAQKREIAKSYRLSQLTTTMKGLTHDDRYEVGNVLQEVPKVLRKHTICLKIKVRVSNK